MNFDIPPAHILRNSHLQRTLLSVKRVARNLGNWYGVHVEFKCYPSRKCPLCGEELKEYRTKRTRIEQCSCGFYEDYDYVPFHWWVKSLNLLLPKWPLRGLKELPTETERPGNLNGLGRRESRLARSRPRSGRNPAALARAGLPRAATPRGGGRAGAVTK